jgi:2-polyprenyl-6-methoxyphenol hydroxylase-like FAD-dependent oxidoreductase
MSPNKKEHAVVLGGSVAGLLAARVLADEFADVTIVERDRMPAGPSHRRGVPQAHHVHALLPRGRQVVEELLPGTTSELVDAGAHAGDILENVRWYVNGRRLASGRTGLTAVSASRPLIEGTIRRRVLSRPNVRLLDGYDIVGVSSTVDGRRVTGARVTSVYGEGSRLLPADLVIDCTGRGSRAGRWIADLGFTSPVEDRVAIDLRYASWFFDVPPEVLGTDVVISTGRFPGQLRGGVLQRIEPATDRSRAAGLAGARSSRELEGGRTLITLAGVGGEQPPTTLDGFTEYAATLAAPDTAMVVRAGRPIGEAVTFRVPAYVRRRYEQLTDLPAGLLVAGDAVCAFNPVYGQGMSVAAATMMVLREELQADAVDPVRFYQAVSRLLDAPWGIAVGSDLTIPGVVAPPMPPSPLTPEYLRNLQFAAVHDPELAQAFVRVTSLIDPPSALLRPEVADRVGQLVS